MGMVVVEEPAGSVLPAQAQKPVMVGLEYLRQFLVRRFFTVVVAVAAIITTTLPMCRVWGFTGEEMAVIRVYLARMGLLVLVVAVVVAQAPRVRSTTVLAVPES
jgi:hypothetical protein